MNNLSIWEKLWNLKKPIRVGVAGGGEFTLGIVGQTARMRNMQVCAIADIVPENARNAFLSAGYSDDDIEYTDSRVRACELVSMGRKIISRDAQMLAELPLDALCDVTGDPAFGAAYALAGIEHGKHVIVVNIESDVGVGAILRRKADEAGVVYTEADGDQPSLIKALFDFCMCLGLDVEVAGKWTHLKPYPGVPSGRGRVNEGFLDGSKNQVEMCCVANMTGLVPDAPGMRIPSLALDDILPALTTREKGGILTRTGVVETVNCLTANGETELEHHLGGGVFVIARGAHEAFRRVARGKGFLCDENGERVLLYRPYHFVGIETPMTILRAALYGEPTASPMPTPVADVVAVAKRDIPAGERLEGIGGANVRGIMLERGEAKRQNALPLVLAQDVCLARPVRAGEVIAYDELASRGDSILWNLRARQDLFA